MSTPESTVSVPSGRSYEAMRAAFRRSIRLVHRPTVTGLENVPLTGPVIIASNHRSFVDSVYLSALSPRQVCFMAKEEYFIGKGPKGFASRTFFQAVGSFPVRRGSAADAVKALEDGEDILRQGKIFGIYPEGTRTRTGAIGTGKTGAAELAIRTGATIVPVGIMGTENVMAVEQRFPRPVTFTVRFGEPIPAPARQQPAGPQRRALTEQIMAAIAGLVDDA